MLFIEVMVVHDGSVVVVILPPGGHTSWGLVKKLRPRVRRLRSKK